MDDITFLSECESKALAFSENVEKNAKSLSLPKMLEPHNRLKKNRELSLAYKSESFALALRKKFPPPLLTKNGNVVHLFSLIVEGAFNVSRAGE